MKLPPRKIFYGICFLGLILSLGTAAYAADAWETVRKTGELRWGGDSAGGAPYVYADPQDPKHRIGFEVEIMDAIARQLHVKAIFVDVPWDDIVPALLRRNFEMAFNGLEITLSRLKAINFTLPYYFFSAQITVRREDGRMAGWEDLAGKKVGTLATSFTQSLLEQSGKIQVVTYPGPVEAYHDLETGRIDAVLFDVPIASFYVPHNPRLKNIGAPVGEGRYGGGLAKDSPELLAKVNEALTTLFRSGELEQIYRRWNLWNAQQAKLSEPAESGRETVRPDTGLKEYIPILLQGAAITVVLSFMSMALAVLLGFLLCLAKLYGTQPVRWLANVYIEVVRGTPLLIQLYLLYYGLPNLGIQLNATTAAILGLGLNYSAYEAEIYRAGLLAVPKGQEEAARCLGMTGWQTLWSVLIPQAARTALPPSTNDFIALFKDTSLVSVITVMELTRAYNQAATSTYRFLELGLLTALLYFLMSFPLSLWARTLEKKQHAAGY